jgi:hypothetical protein
MELQDFRYSVVKHVSLYAWISIINPTTFIVPALNLNTFICVDDGFGSEAMQPQLLLS